MSRSRLHLPSPAMVVACIALIVALSGTALAVSHINGKLIAKRSIPANRLRAHSIGAGEVNKRALGKVIAAGTADTATTAANAKALAGVGPGGFLSATGTAADSARLGGVGPSGFLPAGGTAADSAKLGGVTPDEFVHGRASSYVGAADAPVSPSATDCGETVARTRVLEVPRYGFLDAYCSNYNAGVPICTFTFHNTSGSSLVGARESATGGEKISTTIFLERLEVAPGGTIPSGTNANIEFDSWQLSVGGRQLEARVSLSHPQAGVTACHLIAHVTVLG